MENYKALSDVREFEDLIMQEDFSLVKKAKVNAQLPGLAAPVQVQKVVVQDESV